MISIVAIIVAIHALALLLWPVAEREREIENFPPNEKHGVCEVCKGPFGLVRSDDVAAFYCDCPKCDYEEALQNVVACQENFREVRVRI